MTGFVGAPPFRPPPALPAAEVRAFRAACAAAAEMLAKLAHLDNFPDAADALGAVRLEIDGDSRSVMVRYGAPAPSSAEKDAQRQSRYAAELIDARRRTEECRRAERTAPADLAVTKDMIAAYTRHEAAIYGADSVAARAGEAAFNSHLAAAVVEPLPAGTSSCISAAPQLPAPSSSATDDCADAASAQAEAGATGASAPDCAPANPENAGKPPSSLLLRAAAEAVASPGGIPAYQRVAAAWHALNYQGQSPTPGAIAAAIGLTKKQVNDQLVWARKNGLVPAARVDRLITAGAQPAPPVPPAAVAPAALAPAALAPAAAPGPDAPSPSALVCGPEMAVVLARHGGARWGRGPQGPAFAMTEQDAAMLRKLAGGSMFSADVLMRAANLKTAEAATHRMRQLIPVLRQAGAVLTETRIGFTLRRGP